MALLKLKMLIINNNLIIIRVIIELLAQKLEFSSYADFETNVRLLIDIMYIYIYVYK